MFYVEVGGAELHAAPEAGAPVVLRLDSGRKLIEFERRGVWLRVGIFGAVGREAWIHGSRVAPRPPDRRASSPPALARGPGAAVPTVPAPRSKTGGAARFRLQVSGTPAMKFAGECDLVGADGRSRRRTFAGLVPGRFDFSASALRCRVRKRDARGRLRVELTRDGGLIARAETRAAFNHVRVQSAGPWGAAAGVRGQVRVRQIEIAPEARGRIVPPLTGRIVPPLTGRIVPPLRGRTTPPLSGTIVPPLTGPMTPPLTGPMTPPLTGGPRVFQTRP
ncbi:MAG: hypothetical protein IH786_05855 [Proteobacteria bacterium]|nr:hypothetical protein [Pseudomonadota bacterium]